MNVREHGQIRSHELCMTCHTHVGLEILSRFMLGIFYTEPEPLFVS